MRKRVIITGGNGFVGSHVVEELLQANYSIRCLLRLHSRTTWIDTLPVDIQRVDFFDENALRKAVADCSAILHFGGATKAPDRDSYFRANTKTTELLLEATADACSDLSLFLYCSSQAALGPSPSLDPLTEEAPMNPVSTYGQSKMEAELICRKFAHKFPVTILRPPAIYGPRDKDVFIFFRLIQWGISPSIGKSDRYLSVVHVKDVARICRIILEKNPSGLNIYQVTDGEIHRWNDILEQIAKAMRRRPLKVTVPTGVALFVSRFASRWASALGRVSTMNREKLDEILQSYWLMSSKKAERDLNFIPAYSLERGTRETAQWYQEHHWL